MDDTLANASSPDDHATVAYPWLPTVKSIVDSLGMPPMTGDILYVTSDYSGQQPDSRYSVIAVLLADLDGCQEWETRRKRVRAEVLRDARRMSYKSLNDRRRRRALAPFLCAAGSLRGLLGTVAIDKRIEWLISVPQMRAGLSQSGRLQADWHDKEFEYMARIAFFTSLFTSRTLTAHQNVVWISDEDEIFANDVRQQDVARMAGLFADWFFKVPVGGLFMGTTDIDLGDRGAEDFAAIPDLVAGAMADIFSVSSALPSWPGMGLAIPEGTKPKSDFVLHWLLEAPKVLQYVMIMFASDSSGRMKVGRMTFERG